MQFKDFENLLEKLESNVKEILGDEFQNILFEKTFYYLVDENLNKKLNGMSFNSISIITNEIEIIKGVTVHFSKIINEEFFNQLIQIYGEPNSIKVIYKKEEKSKDIIEDEGFSQEVKKSNIELIEGSFKEDPLYIIWEKEKFIITIFSRYDQGISEISFKSKV